MARVQVQIILIPFEFISKYDGQISVFMRTNLQEQKAEWMHPW